MSNRYSQYKVTLLSLFASLIFAGCSNDEVSHADGIIDVQLDDFQGFIHFDTGTGTRGEAISNMKGKSYDVVVYQYPTNTNWSIFRATGKPGSSNFDCPTKIDDDDNDGVWTYSVSSQTSTGGLVPWEKSRYTFFAYYPQVGNGGITHNLSRTTSNTPHITYATPSWTDINALQDVMIASQMDIENTGNGYVTFTFKHCLSCLSFEARNFDEVETSSDHSKDQLVKNLTYYITSKVYTTLDIPLDETMTAIPSGSRTDGSNYIINNSAEGVTVPAMLKGSKLTDTSLTDNYVFLIPQSPNGPDGNPDTADDNMPQLAAYVEFDTYKYNAAGEREVDGSGNPVLVHKTGNPDLESAEGYDENLYVVSDKNFESGKKYSLIINFTNGQISVAIVESGDWTDTNQTITFE